MKRHEKLVKKAVEQIARRIKHEAELEALRVYARITKPTYSYDDDYVSALQPADIALVLVHKGVRKKTACALAKTLAERINRFDPD